ncbi:hypothetical protein [Xylanibacillus composti]|uniref:hypothetical protein n=1 Tax=Xylanibacillus composti TaxID=1572762 RepID=UPI001BD11F08|nr:hypothetical protein [Xylanibacillus composti]
MQQPSSSMHTLMDIIGSGTIRYDYNARLANYTGPFDYMKLQCDGHCIMYAIHGKHLMLNGVLFALPLSLIKPIYQTFIFPVDVLVDPLHLEIDVIAAVELVAALKPNRNAVQLAVIVTAAGLFIDGADDADAR